MRRRAAAPTMAPMRSAHDIPVLVVGAGPAGLAAAIELTRHDIPTLLVERRTVLSSHPRATVLSLRSMELVRAWGLEPRSARAAWTSTGGCSNARRSPTPPPARRSSSATRTRSRAAWSARRHLPASQDDLEPLLLEHLRASPRARVALGTELTGIFAGPDGARASLPPRN